MNFKYSPGLIGYGAKGADGSAGLPGLALYFTDRNPLTDFITIKELIKNDEVLWSTAVPGTKLPGGRSYSTGDLIIDPRGFIYIIDNETTGDYSNTGMTLNKSTFFEAEAPAVRTDNGFDRFFNKTEEFIIDNVYTDINGINYSSSPSKIYGISPRNFARIEYSNISDVSYNAFSIYSSGETVVSDDHKSLALVRDVFSNNFRIGNLDGSNSLRDADSFLDFYSLRQTKEPSKGFSNSTPSGTILTNYEVSTNLLFDPNFSSSPVSFTANATSTSVKIDWKISDFTTDAGVKAILYFYKKPTSSSQYDINDSVLRPLMFYIDPNSNDIGSIIITHLTLGIQYEYYMSIYKDGWERNSIVKQITTTNTPIFFNILDPASVTLTANYDGTFTQNSNKIYPVSINTNSFTGWNLTTIPKPSWVGTSKTGNPVAGFDNFDVSLSINSGTSARSGNITFSSEAANKTIAVTQNCYQTWVQFDDEGNLLFYPALTDQNANVTIKIYAWVRVKRDYAAGSRTGYGTIVLKQNTSVLATAARTVTASNGSNDSSTYTSYTAYINPLNQYDWSVDYTALTCQVDRYAEEPGAGKDDYEYSMVWAEITSAYITGGTGRIDISTNKIWKASNLPNPPYAHTCNLQSGAQANAPTMPPFV